MSHKVTFSPEAQADLLDLYDNIAGNAGAETAIGYIGRIEAACHGRADFPERGTRRDDLRPGLRVIGFERRAVIALQVAETTVTILRILYGGRDLDAAFTMPEGSC